MLQLDLVHRSESSVLRLLGVLVLGPLLWTATMATMANAGGLYVNEYSTTSQGNAGAGRGAWVPDASAALHNPASMTQLDDHGFATGLSLAFGDVHFDADPRRLAAPGAEETRQASPHSPASATSTRFRIVCDSG